MRILQEVLAEARSISELAESLRLHRMTLRYHLAVLMSMRLVEQVRRSGPRRVGRPAMLYRASRHIASQSFPRRRFDFMAQLVLETYVDPVGEAEVSQTLRTKAQKLGESSIRNLKANAKPNGWTTEDFERVVVRGLFAEFGLDCEVVERTDREITYRAFNCPFLELAERMPRLVCDALDEGFHRGIDRAMGGVRTRRLACMGHGDPYCEYVSYWTDLSQEAA